MKWMPVLLLLSIIIETTFSAMPLTLIVASICAIIWGPEAVFWIFIAGLLLDLFSHRLLGVDSLIFLLILWVAQRYQEKINERNTVYMIIFISVTALVYLFIFYRYIDIQSLLFAVVSGSVLLGIISRFSKEEWQKKRLTVE